MEDKSLNLSLTGQLDPFPAELVISLLGAGASILGVVLTYRQLKSAEKRDKIEKEILEATLELHNMVDDFTLVLGRVAPEFEEKNIRFRKCNIFMAWRDFRRYDGIEEKLTEILNKVRDLSNEMRKAVLNDEIKKDEEQYFDKIAFPMDNLMSKFSNMTFSDFCSSLRNVLEQVEKWLRHSNQ